MRACPTTIGTPIFFYCVDSMPTTLYYCGVLVHHGMAILRLCRAITTANKESILFVLMRENMNELHPSVNDGQQSSTALTLV